MITAIFFLGEIMGIIEANLLVFIAYNISFLISLFKQDVANIVKKIILMLSYSVIGCYNAVISLIIELINEYIKSKIIKFLLVVITIIIGIFMYKNIISILPFIAVLLIIIDTKNKLVSNLLLISSNIIWMIYDYNCMLYLKFIILIYVVGYEILNIVTRKVRYEGIKKSKSSK